VTSATADLMIVGLFPQTGERERHDGRGPRM